MLELHKKQLDLHRVPHDFHKEPNLTPLKFGSAADVTNILLIDSDVQNYEIFFDSANSCTLPIVYSQQSDRNELLEYLKKFTNVQRLALAFNNALIKTKIFMNREFFFTEKDITDGTDLSPNCQFMINLISQLNIQHVDFLVCKSLQEENWKKYYQLLQSKTNARVGASENETGNIKYGGDWVMENTKENVQTIYWTNNIENYTQTLVDTMKIELNGDAILKYITNALKISTNGGADYTTINGLWPVTITGSGTLTFGGDFELKVNTNSCYFIISSPDITIDGDNHKVTIENANAYPGLIKNGDSTSDSGNSNTTIKNIKVEVENLTSTLKNKGGWICQSYFANGAINCKVYNCNSNGDIYSYLEGGGGEYAGLVREIVAIA